MTLLQHFSDSLVEFEAKPLASPSIVYINPELCTDKPEAEILDDFGCMASTDPDVSVSSAMGTREWLADRYGGPGIGSNGGSVRCGIVGGYQVKGIGCTPLIGANAPGDYRHGGMSIFEAIDETVWGEVFNIALPYGAVRALAVLGTGTSCWWVFEKWGNAALEERYGTPPRIPRGLVVRESAVRPAHFFRAINFRPLPEHATKLVADVRRIRQAIGGLSDALPRNAGCTDAYFSELSELERLRSGLIELAVRCAAQSATAKMRRLVHGNISASNICLDGRWIDFGSATAIPGWGEALGYGPFWDDRELYSQMFSELCFYIHKYLPLPRDVIDALAAEMSDNYVRRHDAVLRRAILSMTGICHDILSEVADDVMLESLYDALRRAMADGYCFPQGTYPREASRFGGVDLEKTIVGLIGQCEGGHEHSEDTRCHGDESEFAIIYRKIYRRACDFLSTRGVDPAAFRKLTLINASKSVRGLALLERENMVKHTEQLVLNANDMNDLRTKAQKFVGQISRHASLLYEDNCGHSSRVYASENAELVFDAKENALSVVDRFGVRTHPGSSAHAHETILREAEGFWGDHFWRNLCR
jgi:hypothetical protein